MFTPRVKAKTKLHNGLLIWVKRCLSSASMACCVLHEFDLSSLKHVDILLEAERKHLPFESVFAS